MSKANSLNLSQNLRSKVNAIKTSTAAFTLIELMVVVGVIGVLAVTGASSYGEYKYKVKVVESHIYMSAIEKSEMTFFIENGEFRRLYRSPTYPYSSHAPADKYTVADTLDLRELGYPITVGTVSNFSYTATAGKTDGSGADITRPSTSFGLPPDERQYARVLSARAGANLYSVYREDGSGLQACDPIINIKNVNGLDGASPANYNWVVLQSYANFKSKYCEGFSCDSCTVVLKRLTYHNEEFQSTPFITFKEDLGAI